MKKPSLFGITVLALAAVSFSGCNKIDEIDDVEFHSDFEQEIAVIDPTPGENRPYSQTITFDATTDPEIDKYKSKIKGFTIEKLSYIINDANNPTSGSRFSGTMGFSASGSASATVLASITNLDLDDNITEHEITLAQADLDKIAGYLRDDKAVKIYLTGVITQTPIDITVTVKIKATVTANAL